jgi:hypothetical protein
MLVELLTDRFEVGPQIGRGGMGTVHRGLDRSSGRHVAIKFIAVTSIEVDERFERESAALALLDHPNIVHHVAHGRTDDACCFIVMDWLEGTSLDAELERQPPTLRTALQIASQLAHALVATHAQGLVHRDLKPSNVLLVGGRARDVRLIDFGIARRAGEQRLTQAGMVMGTPGFMAPEQIRGGLELDGRADLYALGAILFRCIAGRMPFVEDSMATLLMRAVLERAPRLSTLLPLVPPSVDDLVAGLLEMEPERRPANARAVADAVDTLLGQIDGLSGDYALTAGSLGGGERLMRAQLLVHDPVLAVPAAADTSPVTAESEICGEDVTAPVEAHSGSIVSLVPDDRTARERQLAECVLRFGGEIERTADALRIVHLRGTGAPADEVRRAVRCAEALRQLLGDAGLSLRVVRTAFARTGNGALSGQATGAGVRDGAAAAEQALVFDTTGLRLDETAATLLASRYPIERDAQGPRLRDFAPALVPGRRILGRALPFLGRERELGLLQSFFEESLENQSPRVVVVTGPPGQGKSGLLTAALQRFEAASEIPVVWRAQADPLDAGAPFSLIARVLVSTRKASGRDTPSAERTDTSTGATPLREGCEALLLDAARALPEGTPIVLAVDDLHWADAPSVRALDALVRGLSGRAALLLALARPELDDVFPRLWSTRSPQRITLGELGPRAALSLVKSALGDRVSATDAQQLVARAAGNVFCLEELIRAVAAGRTDTLPDSVLALVQARLLALEPRARRVLRLASLFGERFATAGVTRLAAAGDQGLDAAVWLRVLVEREIILPDTSAPRHEPGWRFTHALVRDAAYELFTPEDRALAHRQVAELLAEASRPDPARIAHHLLAGDQPVDAARWIAQSADQALRAGDPAGARKSAERALQLAGEGWNAEARGKLLCTAGEAARLLGDSVAARTHFTEALSCLTPGSPAWYQAQRNAVLMGMTDAYTPRR